MNIQRVKENAIKKIKNILDTQYVKDIKIDDKKIISNYNIYKQKGDFTEGVSYNLNIKEMLVKNLNLEISLILVYANLNDKDFNLMLKLDGTNYTYSIFGEDYLIKYNYNKNMSPTDINVNNDYIEINGYNKYNYVYNY